MEIDYGCSVRCGIFDIPEFNSLLTEIDRQCENAVLI